MNIRRFSRSCILASALAAVCLVTDVAASEWIGLKCELSHAYVDDDQGRTDITSATKDPRTRRFNINIDSATYQDDTGSYKVIEDIQDSQIHFYISTSFWTGKMTHAWSTINRNNLQYSYGTVVGTTTMGTVYNCTRVPAVDLYSKPKI